MIALLKLNFSVKEHYLGNVTTIHTIMLHKNSLKKHIKAVVMKM